jgi:hypothetical protein
MPKFRVRGRGGYGIEFKVEARTEIQAQHLVEDSENPEVEFEFTKTTGKYWAVDAVVEETKPNA